MCGQEKGGPGRGIDVRAREGGPGRGVDG